MELTIIGSGRAAWTFASIWVRAGEPLAGVLSRSAPVPAFRDMLDVRSLEPTPESVQGSDLLLFAVPDRLIPSVYAEYRTAIPEEALVFHASGSLTSEVFEHEQRFSLHPLRALDPPGTPVDLDQTLFTWEGAPSTRATAERIARAANAELRPIDTRDKVLYHAAAVFGSNYVAAVLEAASTLLDQAGVDDGGAALEQLAISAIRNWRKNRGAARFTGPIARNDVVTVRDHLTSLESRAAHTAAYRALASILIGAIEEDPDGADMTEMRRWIDHPGSS